ncbi:hypothetical protein PGTUg99_023307 [Puccinia graminis f. sp. tritici]|uniref:Uncharacterized protein n=1 Tax=Puccinia graminis f. sp. tritici TaxID=56615 RepID=A0A5B0RYV0_PUCGR|nr:hypothetical protein PGTUg99_023307 [Puccinia graminis f. sp. tritici]
MCILSSPGGSVPIAVGISALSALFALSTLYPLTISAESRIRIRIRWRAGTDGYPRIPALLLVNNRRLEE